MNLAQTMEQEQQRLAKLLEDLAARRAELDQEEVSIRKQQAAIDAYLNALDGKRVAKAPLRSPGNHQKGLKVKILELVSQSPEGLSRRSLLEKLNATGNKRLQGTIAIAGSSGLIGTALVSALRA